MYICSVEGNSAGIFVGKVPPGIFVIKEKSMPIIFGRIKLPFLGAIKAQLPFSGGKYQLLFRGMKFRSLQFSVV